MISGYTNGFAAKEMSVFSDLLFLDTTRGFDSTGVFGVDNNGNVDIAKDALHGLDFLRTKEYQAFKGHAIANGKFVVGHNRAATRGTINATNAHPFWVEDKIVLVQNGTYKGSHTHLKDTAVDTDAIAHVIAEEETVTAALKKIDASYALVWYNADTKELNLIRNSERPLWLAQYMNSGYVFASEPEMILYAASRAELKLTVAPAIIPEHTHLVFTLDGKGEIKYTQTKLDCAYVHKNRVWPKSHQEPNQYPLNPMALAYNNMSSQPKATYGGPGDIKAGFYEQIIENFPIYMFDSQDACIKAVEDVSHNVKDGYHYVEMLDYIAANDHKHCTVWHVYGAVVDPNYDSEGPAMLIHWIVYNKPEEDILELVTGKFFKVKLSSRIQRMTTINGQKRWLATAFATSQQALTMDNMATQ